MVQHAMYVPARTIRHAPVLSLCRHALYSYVLQLRVRLCGRAAVLAALHCGALCVRSVLCGVCSCTSCMNVPSVWSPGVCLMGGVFDIRLLRRKLIHQRKIPFFRPDGLEKQMHENTPDLGGFFSTRRAPSLDSLPRDVQVRNCSFASQQRPN